MLRLPPTPTLFPYTTPSDLHLDDRGPVDGHQGAGTGCPGQAEGAAPDPFEDGPVSGPANADDLLRPVGKDRSEEHTSELQSHSDLVCRLLLEKKKSHLRRTA